MTWVAKAASIGLLSNLHVLGLSAHNAHATIYWLLFAPVLPKDVSLIVRTTLIWLVLAACCGLLALNFWGVLSPNDQRDRLQVSQSYEAALAEMDRQFSSLGASRAFVEAATQTYAASEMARSAQERVDELLQEQARRRDEEVRQAEAYALTLSAQPLETFFNPSTGYEILTTTGGGGNATFASVAPSSMSPVTFNLTLTGPTGIGKVHHRVRQSRAHRGTWFELDPAAPDRSGQSARHIVEWAQVHG